jgi:hypothetical protein
MTAERTRLGQPLGSGLAGMEASEKKIQGSVLQE